MESLGEVLIKAKELSEDLFFKLQKKDTFIYAYSNCTNREDIERINKLVEQEKEEK